MHDNKNIMKKNKVIKTQWQTPRGTEDIYGINEILKQNIEKTCEEIVGIFNYQKIETPMFEYAEVFKRTVGDTTDIITKELYEFHDKKDRKMALRPEGTAGIVRAIIEHNLLKTRPFNKLYYSGAMFRYERPQKGRQRQFHQFGVENFVSKSHYVDFEIILIAHLILEKLNISAKLVINSLGNFETRTQFSLHLKKYLAKFSRQLSINSQKRLQTNPLRIFDDKIDRTKKFMKDAPKINEFYSQQEKNNFEKIIAMLKKHKINYEIDHTLVRGLDYYTETIFEFVPLELVNNQQSTLIAGGRYDMLMENLGGQNKSGIGFALGIERIIETLKQKKHLPVSDDRPLIFIANLSENGTEKAHDLVINLRKNGFRVEWNIQAQKLSKIFVQSDVFNPDVMIIIGNEEINKNNAQIKVGKTQKTIAINETVTYLRNILKKDK